MWSFAGLKEHAVLRPCDAAVLPLTECGEATPTEGEEKTAGGRKGAGTARQEKFSSSLGHSNTLFVARRGAAPVTEGWAVLTGGSMPRCRQRGGAPAENSRHGAAWGW